MSQQNESQNLDTTYTKIFVGGLPWATRNEGLRNFFRQFGEIIHVNVVLDKQTERSKGYGFVTFKDAESAARACENPNPTVEERIANCNLASNGVTVNRNQTGFPQDDLSYLAPNFWLNQQQSSNLHQLLPNRNQYYNSQWQYNLQYAQQYFPQNMYCSQFDPQYYQHYSMVYTNNWVHQSVNAVQKKLSNLVIVSLDSASTSQRSSIEDENDNKIQELEDDGDD